MSWQNLLSTSTTEVLPFTGGKFVQSRDRIFTIAGKAPREYGWFRFAVDGSKTARLESRTPEEPNPEFLTDRSNLVRGYLIGDRLIEDGVPARANVPLPQQTKTVFGAPLGLPRFARAACWRDRDGRLTFLSQEWPLGPEDQVQEAYQDRKPSLQDVPGVTPALEVAFRFLTEQRRLAEEAEAQALAERARAQAEAERRAAAAKAAEERERLIREYLIQDTGPARRALAQHDFKAAAKAALAVSGAELLDSFPFARGAMAVQYRYKGRRLECTCDPNTLRIINAGVCLDDHRGTKGDTRFTLESLPAVIDEALDRGILVVWGIGR